MRKSRLHTPSGLIECFWFFSSIFFFFLNFLLGFLEENSYVMQSNLVRFCIKTFLLKKIFGITLILVDSVLCLLQKSTVRPIC